MSAPYLRLHRGDRFVLVGSTDTWVIQDHDPRTATILGIRDHDYQSRIFFYNQIGPVITLLRTC